MEISTNTKFHIGKIDFLRGVAIFLVFLYHVHKYLFFHLLIDKYNSAGFLDVPDLTSLIHTFSPSANGWVGVELFFVISGFLIHLIYLRNESAFTVSTFYSKRFWRIYPPYIITLIFFFVTEIKLHAYNYTDFFTHVFMVHNFSDKTFFTINPALWSLALEMQMYLIYPVFLWIRKKAGISKAFIFSIILSAIFGVVGNAFHHFGTKEAFHTSLPRYWFIWCAGAYVAERYFNGKRFINGGFLYFAMLYVIFIASKYTLYTSKLTMYLSAATCVSFLELILYSSFFESQNFFVNCFTRGMSLLGLCSYSFYLIHHPYLPDLLTAFNSEFGSDVLSIVFSISCSFIIIFLISYSLYILLELPAVQIGERLRKRKATPVNS